MNPSIFRNPKVQKILNQHSPNLMPPYLRPALIRWLWGVVALLIAVSAGVLGLLWYGGVG